MGPAAVGGARAPPDPRLDPSLIETRVKAPLRVIVSSSCLFSIPCGHG